MNRLPSRPIEVFLQAHYLAKIFDARQRLRCYNHNFEFLTSAVRPFSLSEWFGAGLPIFERRIEEIDYRILLSMPTMHRNQGELAISLLRDGAEIYAMGFTLVPGAICGVEHDTAILISRMQGAAGRVEDVHDAAKAFHDITPQALLFASLQGCARALGVTTILGTGARIQLSFSLANPEHFLRCYDAFFESVGATAAVNGLYAFDCRQPIAVLDNLPAKHRARTKAKRRIKAEIDEISFAAMRRCAAVNEASALAPLHHISAVYLATEVGEKQNERIVTAGRSGLLVCGPYPYARLDAGRYEVRFAFDPSDERRCFTFDVAGRRGRRVLAKAEFDGAVGESEIALRLALEQPEDEVEFRVFVSAATNLAFRGVTVLRETSDELAPA